VAARAEKLAAAPYHKSSASLVISLKALTCDQFRDIRFRPERALWRSA
jgi:periplasmic glucans biosynthesis protein